MLQKKNIYSITCCIVSLLLGTMALAENTLQESAVMRMESEPSVASEQSSFLNRFDFHASLSQGY